MAKVTIEEILNKVITADDQDTSMVISRMEDGSFEIASYDGTFRAHGETFDEALDAYVEDVERVREEEAVVEDYNDDGDWTPEEEDEGWGDND
jgi:hypothetical protein